MLSNIPIPPPPVGLTLKKDPPKKAPIVVTISTIILAAAAGVSGLTVHSEGTYKKAYLDPVGIPTICNGHTKGVKLGMTASDAQCKTWLIEDIRSHMAEAVKLTPTLAENHNALMATGDLVFNTGLGGYKNSPMSVQFAKRNWTAGCNAFPGWYTGGTYATMQSGMKCVKHPGKPGKFKCELKGLVTRRLNEQKICLTGKW